MGTVELCYTIFMNTEYNLETILDNIEFLLSRYSMEYRAMTQPYLLQTVTKSVIGYTYNPADHLVRETLIEHVGCLPIIATALYPYINDSEVNLGDALIMLAVHDIGELVVGDENVFTKNDSGRQAEFNAGLGLLHTYYHPFYEAVENKTTKSAKFAKSVDKVAADIIDYLTPANITKERLKHFADFEPDQIVPKIIEFKRPHMIWNPFLEEFHIHLISRLAKKLNSVDNAKELLTSYQTASN